MADITLKGNPCHTSGDLPAVGAQAPDFSLVAADLSDVSLATYAGKKTSLAKVSKACGCENVIECQAEETADVLKDALASNKMTIIVCKCQSGNIPVGVIDIAPVSIRDRFMAEVKRRAGA